MASVGMMDPAYFVGKVELLSWLNDLLKLNYSKVEQVKIYNQAHCPFDTLAGTPFGT